MTVMKRWRSRLQPLRMPPKGARRFSEKYFSNGQAQASASSFFGLSCSPEI